MDQLNFQINIFNLSITLYKEFNNRNHPQNIKKKQQLTKMLSKYFFLAGALVAFIKAAALNVDESPVAAAFVDPASATTSPTLSHFSYETTTTPHAVFGVEAPAPTDVDIMPSGSYETDA